MTGRAALRVGLMPGMIGAVAMIGQVVYLRLVAQSFYGNELTMCIALGHWLVWTGLGSLLGTKLGGRDWADKYLLMLVELYGLTLIVFAGLLYLNRTVAGIPTGEIAGLGMIFGWTFLFFSLPALLNGFFFPLIVSWSRRQIVVAPINTVYAAEVIGAAIGSLIFAGLILAGVDTINCLLIIVWFMLILALRLFLKNNGYRSGAVVMFIVIIAAVLLNKKLAGIKWEPFKPVMTRESPQAALTTVQYKTAFSLYSDSQPLWTFGEREQAEELTHFALLNHPAPQMVLVVGLGNAEIVREIRRHPTVRKITIVQPDRIVQEMLNHFAALETDSVVKVLIGDPLRYLGRLSRIGGHYDVVLLNIPLPVNAQWNRFYTREFLATVQRCIGEDGLLMLNFPGDEEFLTTAQVEFLKTMQNTARQVFRETTWIPGLTAHLLVADTPLTNDPQHLIATQQARKILPLYVGEYFLTDRLSAWKVDFLTRQIDTCPVKEINTLARPVGYYYDTVLWGQRTGGLIRKMYPILKQASPLLVLIGFAVVLIVYRLIVRKNPAVQTVGKMSAIGFWVMGLESVAIILFQCLVGSVYLWIVFLIFTYMLGSGLGAITERKHPGRENPRWIRLTMILSPAGLALPLLGNWPTWIVTILIGLILLIGGLLAGYLFPFLVRNYTEQSDRRAVGAGRIYAADIFGSALGVYLISGIVIPIWGIIPALGMVIITSAIMIRL